MQPGDIFEGRYKIIGEIGAGGFANVYLAEHLKIAQRVAIKVLLDAKSGARFLREGQILAKLTSPYTMRILDFGETPDGYQYMISEYIEGETLEDLHQRGPIPADDAVRIMEQTLESLAEAHAHGIVHRDVKPANIMRLPDGSVKVLDFGIARVEQSVDPTRLTGSGVVIGTPRYLAPEVLLTPESVSPAADIFALGLVLFALLTGREANEGLTSREIVARHLNTEPYDLPDAPGISEHLREWARTATNKISTKRYADAGEALAALQRQAPEAPRTPQSPEAPPALQAASASAELDGPSKSDGSGIREIELDLGDAAVPAVARPRPRPTIPKPAPKRIIPKEAPMTANRRGRAANSAIRGKTIVLLAFVLTGGVVAGSLYLGEWQPFKKQRPAIVTLPPDAPEVTASFDSAKLAFEEGKWFEAIEGFHKIEEHPKSQAARELFRQDYIGRAIANVLEEAVDARESANGKRDLSKAAEGPRRLLKLYPDHEAAQDVLVSIEGERAPKKKKRRKIKIERGR